jgi:hypothetical protein
MNSVEEFFIELIILIDCTVTERAEIVCMTLSYYWYSANYDHFEPKMDSKCNQHNDELPAKNNVNPLDGINSALQTESMVRSGQILESPKPMKRAKIESYSNRGLSSTLSHAIKGFQIIRDRIVARSRIWNQEINDWDKWIYYVIRKDCLGVKTKTFALNRGGKLKLFVQLVPDVSEIQKEMIDCKCYRQYSIRTSLEPRVHALFSNKKVTNSIPTGYRYGTVNMQAHPLNDMNHLAELSSRLARRFKLPSNEWNIGLDLLIYRDGKDSIHWHADDTQGEDIIMCLTIETPKDVRTVCFQPSLNENLRHGDEQIELFPIAGDAYQMDGKEFLLLVFVLETTDSHYFPQRIDAEGLCSCSHEASDLPNRQWKTNGCCLSQRERNTSS